MVTIELVGLRKLDGLRVVLPGLVQVYRMAALDREEMRLAVRYSGDTPATVKTYAYRFVITGRMTSDGCYVFELDREQPWEIFREVMR